MPAVDLRDLLHYPFLKEAQGVLASRGIKVAGLSESPAGKMYLDKAAERVVFAIDGKELYPEDTSGDNVSDIVTYVLARILVSCTKDKRTIDRFVRAEARRVCSYLSIEQNTQMRMRVSHEFGVSLDTEKLSVQQYVEMAATIREDKWRLINRVVERGKVEITADERDVLLSEKIRAVLGSTLPLAVPGAVEREFAPWTERLIQKVQERTMQEFGEIDESAYPPCIQTLINDAAAGVNLTHAGRFSLVAFLHNIGMSGDQIEGIFARSPDYNPDMTEYQVDHILTNDYTSPSCVTMLTHGVCAHKDKLCESVAHPLSYYREKKRYL
ncbi:MAG: DNA primase large subunit PriL, partial [Methanocorpusculum sp.]|nr:DNA primase large subunit PriL [Methanocorpusculum sp.]